LGIKERKVNIVLLNRNYPPQSGITGQTANELFKFLKTRQLDLSVVHVNGKYSGNLVMENGVFGKTYTLNTFYNGKLKILRLLSSLYEGYMLVRKAISMKPDIVISMTDPPLLSLWVSIFCKKKNIPWVYWTMDLYPEAFVSAGLIKKTGIIFNLIKKTLKKYPPKFIISLGHFQFEYLRTNYDYNIPSVLYPCGIIRTKKMEDLNISKITKNKISLCYAGNLGEAHNPQFIMNIIDNLNPKKHVLFLSLYGSKSNQILEYSKNKKGVYVIDNIARENMHIIDIHLVSLLQKWDHVCVPSKAISAVTQGSTILFESSDQNDNWKLLKDAGWRIDFNNNMAVSKFLSKISKDSILKKRRNANKLSRKLIKIKENSFNNILKNLINV